MGNVKIKGDGKMNSMVRQGDILIVPKSIAHSKNRLKEIGKNEKILAYGEKTGHTHVLRGDVTFYENREGTTLCQVGKEGAILVHQEHDPINIDEGEFIVIHQREFDLLDGIRVVSD